MADQKFNITIQTAAPTGPVDALERSMGNLSRTTDRLNELGTPEKAKVSEWAFYDLDQQISRTTNTADKLPGALDQVGKSGRNNATALLMFSQGIEDAQYGIRGVLNNIPGLVMALGGGMGLAGGISIAAVGLSQLVSMLGSTKEKAAESAADIEAAADAYATAVVGALKRVDDERKKRNPEGQIVDTVDTAGQGAEDKAFAARQDNIAALIAATNTLNELMGRQVVAQEAIAAAEAERARKREEEEQQQIKLENRKVEAAKIAVAVAEQQRSDRALAVNETQRQIRQEEEKLKLLEAQRKELEIAANLPLPPLGGGDPTMAAARQRAFDQASQERGQAQAALQAFDQGEIANAKAAVELLNQELSSVMAGFESAANNAFNLAEQLERQNAATQENIKTILEQGQVKQSTDAVATAVEADAALGKQITAVLEGVKNSGEELNGLQRGAVASLEGIMADGKVTYAELGASVTSMQQLMSMLVGDVGRMASMIQSAILMANENTRRLERIERTIPRGTTPGNAR